MRILTHNIFSSLFGRFSKDVAIDLGTANIIIYVREQGIVIQEPSVVAINQKTGQFVAIGSEAKRMIGKTPRHINVIRPLQAGVISDFEVTEQILRYFFGQVQTEHAYFVPRPKAVIGIPSNITEVERKSVEEAAQNAGAREVRLVEESVAAAIGARMPIFDALGSMVVDIGGGTTEIAVISLGGLVNSKSLRIAGDTFNKSIVEFVRDEHNVLLGERTAEDAKIAVGGAVSSVEKHEVHVRGRDLVSGLPKEITLSTPMIRTALEPSLKKIVTAIRETVEETPPELISDIMKRGILLTGGGALLNGIDELIGNETEMVVRVADDPLTAVVRGCGIILENPEEYHEVLANLQSSLYHV